MSTPQVRAMNIQKQGAEAFPTPAGWVDDLVLAANTAKSYDVAALRVAAGLKAGQPLFLVFASDGPFWANFNGTTAAVPSGDITDGSGPEYSPNQRYYDNVEANTTISFIATATTHISIQVSKP